MTSLVACLGDEKGTVLHVAKIIEGKEWDKVFLITDKKVKDLFDNKNVKIILINPNKFLSELVEEIKSKLDGQINDTEVALNMISGDGKQHMAVLCALLKLGLGIRMVALTKQGVKEI
ncbi:hypothetical protein CEE44_03665 [Candidatus Woesearchaeota archaeon B3_Woes]|nr:MAG: hypothetical protein CEE44_03665 [Candidatus Woesearchaeota archaeon B3_Woes]